MIVHLTHAISPKQLEWRNNPAINTWTRQNGIITEADMENWRKKIANDTTIKMFGIIDPINKVDVGTCGFTSINLIHGTAEFSLLIDPEHHRKGYGRAALQELFNYGFRHLRLNTIWGETFEDNNARKLFSSIGMSEEGFLRNRYFKNGSYKNSVPISITRSEWKAQSWSQS